MAKALRQLARFQPKNRQGTIEGLRASLGPGQLTILLVAPRYSQPYFPLGLAYLSSFVRQFGHRVVTLNMHEGGREQAYARLQKLIEEHQPEVIGCGGISVAFAELERLIPFIRANAPRPTRLVLGGGITSCESALIMRELAPDAMVVGEGEFVFTQLLDAYLGHRELATVKGIWHWQGDTPTYTGEGEVAAELDDLPRPDLGEWGQKSRDPSDPGHEFSYHRTRLDQGHSVSLAASRSCPFRCTFCYHAGMGAYRRHSMAATIDLIESTIEQFGAQRVVIYDELFSANRARIYEFCQLIEERQLKFEWFCQLRVDHVDQPLLERMRASGCVQISYGFESGSDTVLASMQKKIVAQQIVDAVKATRAAGIAIQANFLFGDPAETNTTLEESLALQSEHQLYFNDWSAVIPYPGTALWAHAIAEGLITDTPEAKLALMRGMCDSGNYLWKHMINLTAWPEATFRRRYLELRERNDALHRRRPIKVIEATPAGPALSRMIVACPDCNWRSPSFDLPYPMPQDERGKYPIRAFLGVPGVNIECAGCGRKAHLPAREIPHVARVYEQFMAELRALVNQSRPIVVLPALDRYDGVITEDLGLNDLSPVAVLDTRPHRVGQHYLGQTVRMFEESELGSHSDRYFVLLPWVEALDVRARLLAAGIPHEQILCWNHQFLTLTGQQPSLGPNPALLAS